MSTARVVSIVGGILIAAGLTIVFYGLFISERHPCPDVAIVGADWSIAAPGLAVALVGVALIVLSFARR